MPTPPTVLANVSPPGPSISASTAEAAKFPVIPVVLAVVGSVIAATLGIGGGLYYLARSGRLPGSANLPHRVATVPPVSTHLVLLEPLLVNLADAGGTSYVRVSLALRVADGLDKEGSSPKEEKAKDATSRYEAVAPARDTVLTVLGKQTSDELLAANGKEYLRAALKAELADRDPELKVKDVYLTDFLVQR